MGKHWREQLASLAALAPGWFDANRRKGRWGVPPDEGALTTARRFLECLGDLNERYPPRCDVDPQDGDIHLAWHDRHGGTLSVYVAAGYVYMVLGHRGAANTPFCPNRNETPFTEALDLVRGWFQDNTARTALGAHGEGE